MIDEISFYKLEKYLNLNSSVYLVKIANGNVVAVTKNNLLRFSLNDQHNIETINIPSDNDLAHTLFIDPTGNHVIICMKSNQSFYLPKSSRKLRFLKELKGFLLESVGWNIKQATENSTHNILFGTSTGDLFETRLSCGAINTEQYWNKLYMFDSSVTGILFDSYVDPNSSKYILIVTTPTNIYNFFINIGNTPRNQSIFSGEFEKINLQVGGIKCTTFPLNFGYSDLDHYYDHTEKFPNYISWMNGAGIYVAEINQKPFEAEGNVFLRPKLLNYSNSSQNSKPFNVANTKYHIVLQYSNEIQIFCTLRNEVVHTFKNNLGQNEQYLGLFKDHYNGFIYVFCSSVIFRVNCDGETANLWRIYFKMGKYKLALRYCKAAEEKMKIRLRYAENLYDKKKYCKAAKFFASTNLSFEEATLKFIDLENKDGLKTYLLECASRHENETVLNQNTFDVICIWILEIFFAQINIEQFKTGAEITNKSFKDSNEDYKKFMEDPRVIKSFKRNKELIYQKIKTYGDLDQSSIFAEIIEDNLKILEHHLEKDNIGAALIMLTKGNLPRTAHYTYGRKIILTHPKELVDIWIKLADKLEPRKILPILRTVDDEIAIRYVEFTIKNSNSDKFQISELHNFYILLCAKLVFYKKRNAKSDELMNYFQKQKQNSLETIYDPQLALRICMEWKHLEGSIFLHCLLQKHREAVELALKEKQVALAKEVALKYSGSEEVKKHLWLDIAKFIIEESGNVEEVCNLVKTQHSLKLEDILPYFPDSVKIEDFNEAICDSLNYYNKHTDNLKSDVKTANDYATRMREEINNLKHRPICVSQGAKCSYCDELLTLRSFCLFPCQHFFHIHCLEKVESRISLVSAAAKKNHESDSSESNQLKDEPIVRDCCYCGSSTIDIIDLPIINFLEFKNEMSQWE